MRKLRKFDGTYGRRSNTFTDAYGEKIERVHNWEECEGRACAIHAPSDHSMRRFRIKLRIPGPEDIKPLHLERICPHGIGHPDPDDMGFWKSVGHPSMGIHGCDGCCGTVLHNEGSAYKC